VELPFPHRSSYDDETLHANYAWPRELNAPTKFMMGGVGVEGVGGGITQFPHRS